MALYNFLNHYVKTSPDAGSLLRLAQFTKEYKKSMTQELSIPATILTPPLLDGKEQDLIEVYVMLLVKKMDEWTANLMRTEVNDFLQREAQPEVDVDGYYGMQGAVILFQMLNQQIDLALDSNQGAILLRIVEELNRVTKGIQQQWMKLLDSELKKATGDKVVDVKPGFVEYAMALANDQIKSADFTEALNIRLEPLVSNKYKNQINEKLNDTMDGFLDVAKKCVQVLIDIIFHDLKPAVKSLLSTAWYVEDPMAQMIDTLRDYMDDYQSHLNTNLFELLIEDIIDTFLIHYLVAIRKCSKLKIPAAVNKMKEDQNQAFTFFANYKPRRELEGYFDVFDSVLKLISSSKMMVYLDVRVHLLSHFL
jgi:exocyst complex component 3